MKKCFIFAIMLCCCYQSVKLTIYIPHIKNRNLEFIRNNVSANTINDQDKLGRTLLHYAAEHDAPAIVDWLLSNGADISLRDNNFEGALEIAHRLGHRKSFTPIWIHRLRQLT